jgi:hypothetical protein
MEEKGMQIRAWYVSSTRLLELLDLDSLPPSIQRALESPNTAQSKHVLANVFGQYLLPYFKSENIFPLYRLITAGQLKPGVRFTYQGHFYGKGFGASNRTPHVSLSENISEVLDGKKLLIEFTKNGLVTDTAYTRLSGSTNLFAFCSVTEITDEYVKAVPYLIGDLVESGGALDLPFRDFLRLHPQQIDQFSEIDFSWNPTKAQFNKLKMVPEEKVKEIFCKLFSEFEVPKDWGGEESDIFSSNLSIDGERHSSAFLLKGPAKFHEMRVSDCGKNGDQIYRLFNTPASVFILQHCHKVSPAVRKTMEAFALSQYSRSCRYMIIDGYDTARILHKFNVI